MSVDKAEYKCYYVPMNQNTQLKYITRNGNPDSSFQLSLKRQTATRTIKRLLHASTLVILDSIDRAMDDLTHTHFYYKDEQVTEQPELVTARQRNHYGQYIAS